MTTRFQTDSKGRQWILKDPDAVLDYPQDWADYLALIPGASIDTVTVTAANDEPTINVDSSEIDGSITIAWISGGTPGAFEGFTYHIVTAQGREDDRTLYVKIKER